MHRTSVGGIGNYEGGLRQFAEVVHAKAIGRAPGRNKQTFFGSRVKATRALPWKPKIDEEQTTQFVLPKALTVTGRVRPPPGLTQTETLDQQQQTAQQPQPIELEDLPETGAETSIVEPP